MTPRTPHECKSAASRAGLKALAGLGLEKDGWPAAFGQKVAGRGRQNAWMPVDTSPKSLIVDSNLPTGSCDFSTSQYTAPTCLDCFSTLVYFAFFAAQSLYLFLSYREEREKEAENKQTLIHGFAPLLKKASTGSGSQNHRKCGNVWKLFSDKSMVYASIHGFHASTACSAPTPPGDF